MSNPQDLLFAHNFSIFHHLLGSPGPQLRPLRGPTPTSAMTTRDPPAGSGCRRVAWLRVCSCPRPAAALNGSTPSSHPPPPWHESSVTNSPRLPGTQRGLGHSSGTGSASCSHYGCHPHRLPLSPPSLPPSPARPGVSGHLFQLRQLPALRILEF